MKRLNKKSKYLLCIIIGLFLLIAGSLYYHSRSKVLAYKMGCSTEDLSLMLENFTLISTNGDTIIEPTWTLRTGSSNKDTIKDIKLVISSDKANIYNMCGSADVNTPNKVIHNETITTFVHNIKLDDNSIINFDITYSINGEVKHYTEDLELKLYKTQIMEY